MNWFGKKKSATEPSSVSATSAARPADPQVAIVRIRETIANQEKRYVRVSFCFFFSSFYRPTKSDILSFFLCCLYREEHIDRKITGMIKEAKEKMAKGDKKGTYIYIYTFVCFVCHFL